MACACKANQDIAYLQQKYGVKGPQQKQTHIRANASILLQSIGAATISILFSPILFLSVICKIFINNKKNIKIEDIFFLKNLNFVKDGKRKQQIVPN